MKRIARVLLIALAMVYAVQGGEYSTSDLLRQRSRQRLLEHEIDSLQHEVDSLSRLKRRIASDPATQERIAREDFGMVRGDRELLYRLIDRDSLRSRARQSRDRP